MTESEFENPEHLRKYLNTRMQRSENDAEFSSLISNTEICAGLTEAFNTKDHIKIMALSKVWQRKISEAINDALELEAFSSEYIANLLEQEDALSRCSLLFI